MKKFLGVTLGILTAVGGFVDIGDIVANSATGARFGMSLAWAVVLGVVGIIVFAEMSGRVAAVSKRATFDLVRERLGARTAFVNLGASFFITLLTLIAEVAGVALAIQLATDVNYLLWIPLVGFLVWLVIWRVKFESMETTFGLMGLAMIVAAVAVWQLHPDWGNLWHQASHPVVASGEGHPTYFYYAIALFGAAMTPYEVFFFSSGAVEEKWTRQRPQSESRQRADRLPVGRRCCRWRSWPAPRSSSNRDPSASIISRRSRSRHRSRSARSGWRSSSSPSSRPPSVRHSRPRSRAATRCRSTLAGNGASWSHRAKRLGSISSSSVTIVLAVLVGITAIDPIKVTEYSIVLSAAALPLTYFPIFVIANDRDYMGDKVNSRFLNTIASFYMVLLTIVAIATIPLMIATKAGA